jgi:hypothetical protein
MDRRDALKLFGCAGMSLVTPWSSRLASAEESDGLYGGPFVFCIEARGGWDTTLICDPKGGTVNRLFDESGVATSGAIRFAPVGTNRAFFEAYSSELLVINGIQVGTNSHRSGERHSWSGCLPRREFPTLEAMVAASYGQNLPLAYISFGGYSKTASLVPLSRFRSAETLGRIARPNRIQGDPNRSVHSAFASSQIEDALEQRLSTKAERMSGLFPQDSLERAMLHAVRLNAKHLGRLQEALPSDLAEGDGLDN